MKILQYYLKKYHLAIKVKKMIQNNSVFQINHKYQKWYKVNIKKHNHYKYYKYQNIFVIVAHQYSHHNINHHNQCINHIIQYLQQMDCIYVH